MLTVARGLLVMALITRSLGLFRYTIDLRK